MEKAKQPNIPHRPPQNLGNAGDAKEKRARRLQQEENQRRSKVARMANGKEKAAGKAAGKGKRRGKGGKDNLPDGVFLVNKSKGKAICFKYGNGACIRHDCKMLHVCQICEGHHPWVDCERLKA